MKPKRIQRSRKKGWRKPENAVIVDRTSRWGNPYRVGDKGIPDNAAAVKKYSDWIYGDSLGAKYMRGNIKTNLRGKDLICFCPLNQPCHADVLLRLANT